MHNADYSPVNTTLGVQNLNNSIENVRVHFSPLQTAPVERRLGMLIAEKHERKEFFYGIELAARSFGKPTVLDYRSFGAVLPLFTSLLWFGKDYWSVDRIEQVEAVRFAMQLQPKTIVMPHFTCYSADRNRLKEFLNLNFSNVLALRGDLVEKEQEFQYATQMVAEIRNIRGDSISIGVGGYPEGHPESKSLDDDMEFLYRKVKAGADFIITQICFSSEAIIRFIKNCRAKGITVPIVMGVFVPEDMRILMRISEITKVRMPADELAVYECLSDKPKEFRSYAVRKSVQMITEVFESELDVFGVQFFSMNKFRNIQQVLAEISAKDYFSNKVKT